MRIDLQGKFVVYPVEGGFEEPNLAFDGDVLAALVAKALKPADPDSFDFKGRVIIEIEELVDDASGN